MKNEKSMGSAPSKSNLKKGNPSGTTSKYCYKYMSVKGSSGSKSKY